MTQRVWRHWRIVAGGVISLALLWLSFRGVDWQDVWQHLRHADWALILVALATVLLATLIKAVRWRLMFAPEHRRLRLGRFFSIFLAGQVLNAVIPTRVGEVARAFMIGRSEGVSKAQALWTAVIEKVLDALTLLVFIILISLSVPLPVWLTSAAWTLAVAVLVVLVGLGLALWLDAPVLAWVVRLEQKQAWLGRLRLHHLASVVLGNLSELGSPKLFAGLSAWSLLAFLVASATNWVTARALAMPLSVQACLLLLSVLQISAVVPIPTSPGRVGLYHSLCIITLAIFGYERDLALSYSLVLHLIVYLPMMVLGPLAIWSQSGSWREMAQAWRGEQPSV